ncbi:Macrolide export protein MacA [Anaerolineales bacterium]|nr:Macrolide export protein MacA [Anaerolineales bacterium]
MPSKIKSLLSAQIQKLFKGFGKKTWWGIALLLILAVGGGVTYFQMNTNKTQTTETETLQTTVARESDLVLYASGTGTLVSMDEVDLGFKSSGQVEQINVEVGDKVKAGDVLAIIDDSNAQVQYTQAKRNLLELTSPVAIATAEEEIATAQIGVQTAISQLAYLISPTVYYWETEITKADQKVIKAKKDLEESPNDTELQKKLSDAEAYLDFAKDKLEGNQYYYEHEYVKDTFTVSANGSKYVAEPTDADIAEARAELTAAKATLQEAEYYYAALTGGEVPEDATGSKLGELEQAKLDLKEAELELAGTTLVSPINGTVMSVDMSIGDTVGTSAVITVADLSQQYLEIFLDESDWANIRSSYPAEIIFDILPDSTFNGVVTQVDPGLYSESGTTAVRAIVKLTDVDGDSFNLPLGTSASVDVIAGEATDAILIPVEALHDAGNGQYGVFVMTNGEPRLQLVEIGIQDLTSVEITSGLNPGDMITTGIAETQ